MFLDCRKGRSSSSRSILASAEDFPWPPRLAQDFPRWIIEMMLDRNPHIPLDGWTDGLLMLRFDDAVFVPREKVYEGLHA